MKGGKTAEDDQIRVQTIYRLKQVFEDSGFKTVSASIVTEQLVCARRATKEVSKFEQFLEPDLWPTGMLNQRRTLLQTTKCDDMVTSNQGNDFDVLPWLVKLYASCAPLQVEQN